MMCKHLPKQTLHWNELLAKILKDHLYRQVKLLLCVISAKAKF